MNYITPEGYQRIAAELTDLWFKQRPVIVKAISVAAAEGDRSENAEYIYRKKELRELDYRIRYLEKHFKDVKVVQDKPKDQTKVYFGATVTLKRLDVDTEEMNSTDPVQYKLVGMIESRPEKNEISILTPIAKSLLGKSLEDEVTVLLPEKQTASYRICSIHY